MEVPWTLLLWALLGSVGASTLSTGFRRRKEGTRCRINELSCGVAKVVPRAYMFLGLASLLAAILGWWLETRRS